MRGGADFSHLAQTIIYNLAKIELTQVIKSKLKKNEKKPNVLMITIY